MDTMNYARSELNKYWQAVTGQSNCKIELINNDCGNSFDDFADISVCAGGGSISGSNKRAVLLGVYKFFYLLGCRFIRPGKDGEVIVKKTAQECSVSFVFKPESRYRGVCNEGAVSVENIVDMVEWLPKIGMNSYFMQFVDGHLFFEKWYKHLNSSKLTPLAYSVEQSRKHYETVVGAIQRCGLIFHAVGHGWTTEPLGYTTYGDTKSDDGEINSEHRELFALVEGKRGFFQNSPGNTHMCYSNPKARAVVTHGITDYLKKNANRVDLLHFWLADCINNHCECDACKNTLPSDYYVIMLNELDEKLKAESIDTKIVFLIYCDLLWSPKKYKLNNPQRFVLMYAPIAKNYFEPQYTDAKVLEAANADLPEYVRNKNSHPSKDSHYIAHLQNWQRLADCDSFSFDYHLMVFVNGADLSMRTVSKTLYEDMCSLKKAGLNGNISCQLQRVFFPTALPMYVMAEGLCGSKRSFEEIESEYLAASFGAESGRISEFLKITEAFFTSDYMLNSVFSNERKDYILSFKDKVISSYIDIESACNDAQRQSLRLMQYFKELLLDFCAVLIDKNDGREFEEGRDKLYATIDAREEEFQPYLDCLFFKEGLKAWI